MKVDIANSFDNALGKMSVNSSEVTAHYQEPEYETYLRYSNMKTWMKDEFSLLCFNLAQRFHQTDQVLQGYISSEYNSSEKRHDINNASTPSAGINDAQQDNEGYPSPKAMLSTGRTSPPIEQDLDAISEEEFGIERNELSDSDTASSSTLATSSSPPTTSSSSSSPTPSSTSDDSASSSSSSTTTTTTTDPSSSAATTSSVASSTSEAPDFETSNNAIQNRSRTDEQTTNRDEQPTYMYTNPFDSRLSFHGLNKSCLDHGPNIDVTSPPPAIIDMLNCLLVDDNPTSFTDSYLGAYRYHVRYGANQYLASYNPRQPEHDTNDAAEESNNTKADTFAPVVVDDTEECLELWKRVQMTRKLWTAQNNDSSSNRKCSKTFNLDGIADANAGCDWRTVSSDRPSALCLFAADAEHNQSHGYHCSLPWSSCKQTTHDVPQNTSTAQTIPLPGDRFRQPPGLAADERTVGYVATVAGEDRLATLTDLAEYVTRSVTSYASSEVDVQAFLRSVTADTTASGHDECRTVSSRQHRRWSESSGMVTTGQDGLMDSRQRRWSECSSNDRQYKEIGEADMEVGMDSVHGWYDNGVMEESSQSSADGPTSTILDDSGEVKSTVIDMPPIQSPVDNVWSQESEVKHTLGVQTDYTEPKSVSLSYLLDQQHNSSQIRPQIPIGHKPGLTQTTTAQPPRQQLCAPPPNVSVPPPALFPHQYVVRLNPTLIPVAVPPTGPQFVHPYAHEPRNNTPISCHGNALRIQNEKKICRPAAPVITNCVAPEPRTIHGAPALNTSGDSVGFNGEFVPFREGVVGEVWYLNGQPHHYIKPQTTAQAPVTNTVTLPAGSVLTPLPEPRASDGWVPAAGSDPGQQYAMAYSVQKTGTPSTTVYNKYPTLQRGYYPDNNKSHVSRRGQTYSSLLNRNQSNMNINNNNNNNNNSKDSDDNNTNVCNNTRQSNACNQIVNNKHPGTAISTSLDGRSIIQIRSTKNSPSPINNVLHEDACNDTCMMLDTDAHVSHELVQGVSPITSASVVIDTQSSCSHDSIPDSQLQHTHGNSGSYDQSSRPGSAYDSLMDDHGSRGAEVDLEAIGHGSVGDSGAVSHSSSCSSLGSDWSIINYNQSKFSWTDGIDVEEKTDGQVQPEVDGNSCSGRGLGASSESQSAGTSTGRQIGVLGSRSRTKPRRAHDRKRRRARVAKTSLVSIV